jgi:hypothetical protein
MIDIEIFFVKLEMDIEIKCNNNFISKHIQMASGLQREVVCTNVFNVEKLP